MRSHVLLLWLCVPSAFRGVMGAERRPDQGRLIRSRATRSQMIKKHVSKSEKALVDERGDVLSSGDEDGKTLSKVAVSIASHDAGVDQVENQQEKLFRSRVSSPRSAVPI